MRIKILCFNNMEFEEINKKIKWDTTKRFSAGFDTIQKQINYLKFKLIPYRVYFKEIQ